MMRGKKEIKSDLLAALRIAADDGFFGAGFRRRKGSLEYSRVLGEAQQTIAFGADYCPRCQPGAELHILPAMRLGIECVSRRTLDLVAGNKMLLANAPEVIVNQPIGFAAPKTKHVRWLASGLKQIEDCVCEIFQFSREWVVPFFDELGSPDDLIGVYENDDERMLKQRHWYLFVAGAQLVQGNSSAALTVLEENLGAPGLRKRYDVAFKALEEPPE